MLTVLIPSFNHESYVAECLASAVKIDLPGLRLIVIDDGSSDCTTAVVENFIAKYKGLAKIELFKKFKNEGLVSSLKLGLALTNSEFLYIIASDDVVDPVGIKRSVNVLKELPSLKFIVGGAKYYNNGLSVGEVYSRKHEFFFKVSPKEKINKLFLDYPQPLLLQSTVFRTSTLHEVGGWDDDIKLDDYSMFCKLFMQELDMGVDYTFRFDLNNVMYRLHDFNSYKNTARQFFMILDVMKKYCPENIIGKAVGRQAAYHFLIGLVKIEPRTCGLILKKIDGIQWIWFIRYAVFFVLQRIFQRR